MPLLPALVSLLPVALFLAALFYLDSYKLVRPRTVGLALLAGSAAALAAFGLNPLLLNTAGLTPVAFTRYAAPVVEELLKAILPVTLLLRKRIGFLVDGIIVGFAVGAGFSLVENISYLLTLPSTNLLLWLVRGLGTALMHGGTTAMVTAIGHTLLERRPGLGAAAAIPGLVAAITVHSAYNHFFMSPVISAFATIIGLPFFMLLVYQYSERSTREWLGVGFDTDQSLYEMITTGVLGENRVGEYLHSLQDRFAGEVVADMLCYLRLHVELAMRAKGVLLMREAGFSVEPDQETRDQFAELEYLERSIGKTGMLALHPFLHTSARSLWQLNVLGK